MNEVPGVSRTTRHIFRYIFLPLGVVLFGGLMAWRAELHSVWLRALIAGLAFGSLGLMIQLLRQKR